MKRKAAEPSDTPLKVWVPQSLFDKIDRLAFAEGRSLSTMARRILEAAVTDDQSEAA
jgi:hypothetical protein